ncbi:hypothetical protein [Streptomyces roseifaciens]|uniref:hypothetical protein n=1 Tax=Streptomyces roseifaciens TaxID=1488406 RepID=UPI00071829C8|nr:hypothetical protein [Streptomyces roseifaciens]
MSEFAVRRPGNAVAEVPPPPRWAVRAACASALSATVGFIPLHAVWALGVPLWADEDKFRGWYAGGGGPYLLVLNGLALLAGILALSLVRPWGVVFPSWTPFLAGCRVPRRTLAATAFIVSAFLLLYTGWAAAQTINHFNDDGVFSPWIVAYGIPQFLVWGVGLTIAAHSYRRRT